MYVVSTCTNIVINMCMSVPARAIFCATLYNCPTNDRVCVWFLNEFVILSCVCLHPTTYLNTRPAYNRCSRGLRASSFDALDEVRGNFFKHLYCLSDNQFQE